MPTRRMRIVVIGGLAAGPSAASKAKRVNPAAEVILIERTPYISYGICEIPYYLTGEYSSNDNLIVYSPDRLRREKNVIVWTETEVEYIDRRSRVIQVKDTKRGIRRKEEYDKLILATGSVPRKLECMDVEYENVFTIKELARAYQLKRFLTDQKPRKAVVIGGGYIGLEMVESLRKTGVDVTLIHRHQYPFSDIGVQTGELLVSVLREHGVYFVPEASVEGFGVASDGRVNRVITVGGAYDADLVIVAVGVRPNVSIAQRAGIEIGVTGGIQTDESQMTNRDGIYAAGDCCQVKNLITRRPMYIPLATIASKTGWVAGENAAGGRAVFKGAIRNIAIRVFEYELARVGLSEAQAREARFPIVIESIEAPSRVLGMGRAATLTVTYIAHKQSRKLLGAELIGKDGAAHRANVLASMLQLGATVDEVATLDLMYAPPFSPLRDPLLIAANQILKRL